MLKVSPFRGRGAASFAMSTSVGALGMALLFGATSAAAQEGATTAPVEGETTQTTDDDIVVTGFRASLENAVAAKKERDQVVESISAEDIGKLPDASIAESIARLPGLTSQRISGRSNSISIRGFAPDFSTTLLNGREQTSTGDNRAVEYDQYPAEIMSQVLVYKTPVASLIGQGLSGTVDLRTIRPLEYGRRAIAVGGRGTYADLGKLNAGSREFGYRVNGSYIDQFADDRIGVALSASYLDEPYQIQEFNAWGYPTVNISGADASIIGGSKSYVTSTRLKRLGLQGTVEFRPVPEFTSTIDAFYSDFSDEQIKRGIEVPLAWGSGTLSNAVVEDGFVTAGTFNNVEAVVRNDAFDRTAKLYSFGWNNAWRGDNGWNATLDLSYSRTDRSELSFESYAGTGFGAGNGATDTIGFQSTSKGTVFTPTLDYSNPDLILITDPLGWGGTTRQAGYFNDRQVKDEIKQYRFEVERELDSFLSSVQFGLNYTDREKSLNPNEAFLTLANGATELRVPNDLLLEPTNLSYLGLGPMISYDPQALLANGVYTLTPNASLDIPAKAFTVEEDIMSAYLQANIKQSIGASELTGNFGVQAVGTEQKSTGSLFVDGQILPRTVGADYWDVLPSANLSLRLPSDFVIRVSAARQMMRAKLDDMRVSIGYGLNTSLATPQSPNGIYTGSGGNPYLRPIRANAVDITFEKYFGRAGYLAAQFFYKDLKSFVYNFEGPFDYAGFPTPAGLVPSTTVGLLTRPINGEGGTIKGVELAGTLPLGEIVGFLDGFGVTGGASYTETSIKPTPTSPAEDIPGYSKWVANGTAYFEKWGFSARGSVRYRSSFIGDFVGLGGNRIRKRALDETIVDAQVGYEFQENSALKGLSIFVQGQNLTNEPFASVGSPDDDRLVTDYQRYGRRYLAGAAFKF